MAKATLWNASGSHGTPSRKPAVPIGESQDQAIKIAEKPKRGRPRQAILRKPVRWTLPPQVVAAVQARAAAASLSVSEMASRLLAEALAHGG